MQRRRGGGGRALHGGGRAAGRPRAGFYRRGQRPAPRPGISISLARCRQGRGWDAPGTGRAESRHRTSSGPRGVRGAVPVPPGCGTAERRPCGLEGCEWRRLRSAPQREGGCRSSALSFLMNFSALSSAFGKCRVPPGAGRARTSVQGSCRVSSQLLARRVSERRTLFPAAALCSCCGAPLDSGINW